MADDLYGLVFGLLHGMGHTQLSEEPERIAGLVVPAPEGYSKRQRVVRPIEW
ncbi:hypothetical protein [Mesorhizobium sp. M0088]|uniref:hypothetical protein n=1 Tax=Mesorhizobium sp. M0088 TaxID=2956873 RepID=UPI00333D554B